MKTLDSLNTTDPRAARIARAVYLAAAMMTVGAPSAIAGSKQVSVIQEVTAANGSKSVPVMTNLCTALGDLGGYASYAGTNQISNNSSKDIQVRTGNIGGAAGVAGGQGFDFTAPGRIVPPAELNTTTLNNALANGQTYVNTLVADDIAAKAPLPVCAVNDGSTLTDRGTIPAALSTPNGPQVDLAPGKYSDPDGFTFGERVTLKLTGGSSDYYVFNIGGPTVAKYEFKIDFGNADPNKVFWNITGAATLENKVQFGGILDASGDVALGKQSEYNQQGNAFNKASGCIDSGGNIRIGHDIGASGSSNRTKINAIMIAAGSFNIHQEVEVAGSLTARGAIAGEITNLSATLGNGNTKTISHLTSEVDALASPARPEDNLSGDILIGRKFDLRDVVLPSAGYASPVAPPTTPIGSSGSELFLGYAFLKAADDIVFTDDPNTNGQSDSKVAGIVTAGGDIAMADKVQIGGRAIVNAGGNIAIGSDSKLKAQDNGGGIINAGKSVTLGSRGNQKIEWSGIVSAGSLCGGATGCGTVTLIGELEMGDDNVNGMILATGQITTDKKLKSDDDTIVTLLSMDAVVLNGEIQDLQSCGTVNPCSAVISTAAVAVLNPEVKDGENFSYISSYKTGRTATPTEYWVGELTSYTIDTATGAVNTQTGLQWTARDPLNAKAATGRYIATHRPGVGGAAFAYGSLSSAQQDIFTDAADDANDALTAAGGTGTQATATNLIEFLRGSHAQEGLQTDNTKPYHQRLFLEDSTDTLADPYVLGDIVNAEPVIVRAPDKSYRDTGYATFKTNHANKPKIVYQGANDGMLHAFSAVTDATAGLTGGEELWAFAPNHLLATLPKLSLKAEDDYEHVYYVDGTPRANEVDLNNTYDPATKTAPDTDATGYTPDWRTLLVGGYRDGGRGYYALDITCPTSELGTGGVCTAGPLTEAGVAKKTLWEFSNVDDSDLGLSYATPAIVKTETAGWVVLFTSGYSNADPRDKGNGNTGKGYLYVLNAKTGALIKRIGTNKAAGLGQISAYVANGLVDATTDFVYGGDLEGNVWRFDLRGSVATWGVTRLVQLVDANGAAQPITSAPELGVVGGHRMVYVGTGRFIGDTAGAAGYQPQAIYGIKDDLSSAPEVKNLRGNNNDGTGSLVKQVITDSTRQITATQPVLLATKDGWYADLPNSQTTGERIYTDPALAFGVLYFTSNMPAATPCATNGQSFLYALDYRTGGVPQGRLVQGITTVGEKLGDAYASRPVLIRVNGAPKVVIRVGDAPQTKDGVRSVQSRKRMYWREVTR